MARASRCFHLGAQTKKQRRFFRVVRQIFTQVFFPPVARRLDPQTADLQSGNFSQQELQAAQINAQFGGQLGLAGIASQRRTQGVVSFLQPPGLAPQIARAPVHLPQTVQDRPPDTELGIGPELDMLAVIELLQRINQPQHAGMHQVFQGHVAGQAVVNPARDVTHLRQLFHQQTLAFIIVLPAGISPQACFGHGASVLNRPPGRSSEAGGSSKSGML